MGCAHKENQDGFTLVEIAIVMIIIGLLIGGTFGGMKLIENMQVNKTVQDLKAIDSAAITFKDAYGRLPGDIASPATRLPNCTDAPCSTGGNGDRRIGPVSAYSVTLTLTDERFLFWHHLQSANLLSIGTKNILDMSFGEGQPDAPIGGGYRAAGYFSSWCSRPSYQAHGTTIHNGDVGSYPGGFWDGIDCKQLRSLDLKLDDGRPYAGNLISDGCTAVTGCADPNAVWALTGDGYTLWRNAF